MFLGGFCVPGLMPSDMELCSWGSLSSNMWLTLQKGFILTQAVIFVLLVAKHYHLCISLLSTTYVVQVMVSTVEAKTPRSPSVWRPPLDSKPAGPQFNHIGLQEVYFWVDRNVNLSSRKKYGGTALVVVKKWYISDLLLKKGHF